MMFSPPRIHLIVVSALISLKPQWRSCQYRFPLLVSLEIIILEDFNYQGFPVWGLFTQFLLTVYMILH